MIKVCKTAASVLSAIENEKLEEKKFKAEIYVKNSEWFNANVIPKIEAKINSVLTDSLGSTPPFKMSINIEVGDCVNFDILLREAINEFNKIQRESNNVACWELKFHWYNNSFYVTVVDLVLHLNDRP